jgi:hypothetical protein
MLGTSDYICNTFKLPYKRKIMQILCEWYWHSGMYNTHVDVYETRPPLNCNILFSLKLILTFEKRNWHRFKEITSSGSIKCFYHFKCFREDLNLLF